MLKPAQKILVVGARGMVGSAMVRALKQKGFHHLLTPSSSELNALDQGNVREYIESYLPEIIVIAAAKVGGILANLEEPAAFLYQNVMIASNLIHQAHLSDVPRLLFLGSTCIYPKFAQQPITEEALLSAPLEPSNEGYALAKIIGVKMCSYYRRQYGRDYISAMPTNLYGPGDNYHPSHSHVIPGLIRRFHEAKIKNLSEVVLWGTGKVQREFLYVDDLAKALCLLLERYHGENTINVGSTCEITILELAHLIKEVVGFEGEIVHDLSKPDGPPRKKSDCSKIHALGWRAETPLKEGLKIAYQDFLAI